MLDEGLLIALELGQLDNPNGQKLAAKEIRQLRAHVDCLKSSGYDLVHLVRGFINAKLYSTETILLNMNRFEKEFTDLNAPELETVTAKVKELMLKLPKVTGVLVELMPSYYLVTTSMKEADQFDRYKVFNAERELYTKFLNLHFDFRVNLEEEDND